MLLTLILIVILFWVAAKIFEVALGFIALAMVIVGIVVVAITRLLLRSKAVREKLGYGFTLMYLAVVSGFLLAYVAAVWLLPNSESGQYYIKPLIRFSDRYISELGWPLGAVFVCGIPGALAGFFSIVFLGEDFLDVGPDYYEPQNLKAALLTILLTVVALVVLVGTSAWLYP